MSSRVAGSEERLIRERGRFSSAWFAGITLRLLPESERTFYDTLGAVVLLLAIGDGVAASLTAGYMLQVPAARVWWVGVGWAIFVACGLERLVLQMPSRSKRRVLLLLAVVPRVVVTLLLAGLFAEPMVIRANQGEIANRLSETRTAEGREATGKIGVFYGHRIQTAQQRITHIQARMEKLNQRATHFRFLSECEANTPSCSVTHKPGCEAYCRHYARKAEEAQSLRAAREPESNARIAALRQEISGLEAAKRTQEKQRRAGIGENKGFLAREEALEALEARHPRVEIEAWFLRALFLCLDLLPLSMKVLRMLTVDSPYEAVSEAARRHDALKALEVEEAAGVEEDRIREQARADKEANRESIWRDAMRRINDEHGEPPAPGAGHADLHGEIRVRRDAQPISAWSLAELVRRLRPHEKSPVPVPAALRRGGFAGLALVATLTIVTTAWWWLTQTPVTGMWLIEPDRVWRRAV